LRKPSPDGQDGLHKEVVGGWIEEIIPRKRKMVPRERKNLAEKGR
jgi:hypothetical protein